jgi:hypothetical protein
MVVGFRVECAGCCVSTLGDAPRAHFQACQHNDVSSLAVNGVAMVHGVEFGFITSLSLARYVSRLLYII